MTVADVEVEILTPMQALFLPPRNLSEDDQKSALRAYADALQAFSREDLKQAWSDVICAHTTRAWPVPGVLVLAARNVRKGRDGPQRTRSGDDEQHRRWQEWERARPSAKARKAVDLGVAWSLRCDILHDGKALDAVDLGALHRGKERASVTAGKIERGEPVYWKGRDVRFSEQNAETAIAMYRTLQIREAETEAEIMRYQGESRAA